jgi:uncharacterized membrane protein YedE/YeeE
MLKTLAALLSGTVFGLGLAVSGMMNPAKVVGFLDVAGDWDPTLAFVMGGALLVVFPAFRLVLRRPRPVLAESFELPKKTALDGRLISGSALFGVGWGLSGFCPGPAVAALSTGLPAVLAFVAAMIVGMALHRWTFSRRSPEQDPRSARPSGATSPTPGSP